MLLALDGPSAQNVFTITNTAAFLIKVSTNPLSERKVITLQPLDGRIKVYFAATGETPTAAIVTERGFLVFKQQVISLEASDTQPVYIVADNSNVEVVIAERA